MDLDAYFAENPMGGSFPTNPDFKSGFVTLVGRPNAGKSTLLNAIMGKKIAITSNTAQTTRHRFRAVHTTDDMQMIIVDTPGLHKPQDALGIAPNAGKSLSRPAQTTRHPRRTPTMQRSATQPSPRTPSARS